MTFTHFVPLAANGLNAPGVTFNAASWAGQQPLQTPNNNSNGGVAMVVPAAAAYPAFAFPPGAQLCAPQQQQPPQHPHHHHQTMVGYPTVGAPPPMYAHYSALPSFAPSNAGYQAPGIAPLPTFAAMPPLHMAPYAQGAPYMQQQQQPLQQQSFATASYGSLSVSSAASAHGGGGRARAPGARSHQVLRFSEQSRQKRSSKPIELPDAAPGQAESTQLLITKLAADITTAQLEALFAQYEGFVGARVVLDPATGFGRGYGYLWFETQHTAICCISSTSGRVLLGKRVGLVFAKPQCAFADYIDAPVSVMM